MKHVIRFDVRTFVEYYNEYVYEYGGETITHDEVYDMIKATIKNWNEFEYGTRYVLLECEEFEDFTYLVMHSQFDEEWIRESLEKATHVKLM